MIKASSLSLSDPAGSQNYFGGYFWGITRSGV